MDERMLIRKLQAILHDPPEKPLILGRIGHEGRAKEIMASLGLGDDAAIPEEVRTSDHIAAAADRIDFPKDERFVAKFLIDPIIKHPLSAKSFDLGCLNTIIDLNKITSLVDSAIETLYEKYEGDKEKLYLALWRELLEILKNKKDTENALGQLWELLPADTRIPEHSIWDHKRVTSAISGALPKPAFFLFAIGPIQDFIATARKTQDLWAGSYLLSFLSWSAMRVIVENLGPDSIIFPDLCGQPFMDKWLIEEKGIQIDPPDREKLSSPTLPNRFFAVIPEKDAIAIGKEAEKTVRKTFLEIGMAVKGEMEKVTGIPPAAWTHLWERQTEGFIETYWAFTPVSDYKDFIKRYKKLMGLDGSWDFTRLIHEYEKKGFPPNIGTVYGHIYRLTEKVMGSRKAVREFGYSREENYKCTLCGVREPLHPREHKNRPCSEDFGALRGFWVEEMMEKFPVIRRSERLCAVCSMKRFMAQSYFKEHLRLGIEGTFPSISMIATAAFRMRIIERLDNLELSTKIYKFITILERLFEGKEDRLRGNSIPMVRRMCNSNQVQNGDLAYQFASIEGEWLFIDSFRESLKEELPNYSEELCKSAISTLNEIYGYAKDLKINKPSKYYAILLMDGDNMGKWLSGEMSPKIGDVLHPDVKNTLDIDTSWSDLLGMRRPLSPSIHIGVSRALRDFSLKVVREIVEKDHLGKLVYAGGDDVLAFVGLPHLPDVMRKLRACFSGHLSIDDEAERVKIDFEKGNGFIPVDENEEPINPESSGKKVKGFILAMGERATASMGVVIAHCNTNLSKVLDMVRRAEKRAKKVEEKNAWCVVLSKRSGGMEEVSLKWIYGNGNNMLESIPLLKVWVDAFSEERVSPRFAYHFRIESKGLDGLPEKVIALEITRMAARHCKDKNFRKGELNNIVNGLTRLAGESSLEEIGKFLSLAAFLGREVNR